MKNSAALLFFATISFTTPAQAYLEDKNFKELCEFDGSMPAALCMCMDKALTPEDKETMREALYSALNKAEGPPVNVEVGNRVGKIQSKCMYGQ